VTDRDAFERALDRRPNDWATRLVYADWLEENGEPVLAAGQRWQARYKKRPHCDRGDRWEKAEGHWRVRVRWRWSNCPHHERSGLWRVLGGKKIWHLLVTKYGYGHVSRAEAERALAMALWEAGVTK